MWYIATPPFSNNFAKLTKAIKAITFLSNMLKMIQCHHGAIVTGNRYICRYLLTRDIEKKMKSDK